MKPVNKISVAIGGAVIGILMASSASAQTEFKNPYETANPLVTDGAVLDNLQQTTVVSFTAATSGTLNAYFVGGIASQTVYYKNSVGVVLGALPADRTAIETSNTLGGTANVSGYGKDNYLINFGEQVFNQIQVTAGQKITFVLRANMNGNTGASTYGTNYIWSDERAIGSTGYQTLPGTTNSYGNAGNAMAWTTTYTSANPIVADTTPCAAPATGPGSGFSRDCFPTSRAGTTVNTVYTPNTIAAGTYTYVGFNDWQGGPSNSYYDYSFLFKITCTPGSAGCTGSGVSIGSVPEPGALALAAIGLMGVVGVRRRSNKRVS